VIAISTALVLQALFFGDGGVLAIFANCFNLAIVLPFAAYWTYRLLAAGRTLVVATHELDVVPLIADRAVVLSEDGRVAGDGPAAAILADTALLLGANLIHEHRHRHGRLVPLAPASDRSDTPSPPSWGSLICGNWGMPGGPPRCAGWVLAFREWVPRMGSVMESRRSADGQVRPPDAPGPGGAGFGAPSSAETAPAGVETELAASGRLLDEALAGIELVLEADGVAFWREEADRSLVLAAHRSISSEMLSALDRQVVGPLQSIMRRWPDSPLVAIPLEDPSNPLAEEIRALVESEGIAGLAGVPCRTHGEMLGMLCIAHKRPHPWTVRELGLATGFAGQLATAQENSRLFASVRSMASRLTAIHELSLRLAQLRESEAVEEAIVAEAGRLVECDAVRVFRQDPEDGVFRVVAASCGTGDTQRLAARQTDAGPDGLLAASVAKRNEGAIVPDAQAPDGCPPGMAEGAWSLLMVPMSYGDEVHGVLAVSRAVPNAYGLQDEQALSIFGRYAAQAIVNAANIARLESQRVQLERQVAGERRLLGVSEQLVSQLDPRLVLEQIAETIGMVVHYDRLTIYHHGRDGGAIEAVLSRAHSGEDDAPQAAWLPREESLTKQVMDSGEAVRRNNAAESDPASGPGAEERPSGDGSLPEQNMIVVPLRIQGEVVGSLNLIRVGGPEARFSEPEFELSKLFAGQASIALQNAEAHFTVSTRADLDPLTGLRHHGTFQRDVDTLVEAGEAFSLVMMDLDFFKAFNDTYGHPAGDALLQAVALAVVGGIRQNDRAYRYGGDEFALLLMGASRGQAEEVAARIQAAIREAAAESSAGAIGMPYGASAGVACWPPDGATKTELVQAADTALYEAKRRRGEGPSDVDGGVASLLSEAILDAARDLLAARTAQAVARSVLRHGAAIVGSRDGLVAMPHKGSGGDGRRRRRDDEMRVVVGSGRYHEASQPIKRGQGFWGRLWASGRALAEDEPDSGMMVGAPMAAGGVVWGVVGFALGPGVVVSPERLRILDHLATLAGAAAQRHARSPAGAAAGAAGTSVRA
jgi:diguanylate cyclase (GGDEF)-like protein